MNHRRAGLVVACGVGLALAGAGCGAHRANMVPPERPYVSYPTEVPLSENAVGFSSEPATNGFQSAQGTPTPGVPADQAVMPSAAQTEGDVYVPAPVPLQDMPAPSIAEPPAY